MIRLTIAAAVVSLFTVCNLEPASAQALETTTTGTYAVYDAGAFADGQTHFVAHRGRGYYPSRSYYYGYSRSPYYYHDHGHHHHHYPSRAYYRGYPSRSSYYGYGGYSPYYRGYYPRSGLSIGIRF